MNKPPIQWKPGETVYYVVREGFERGKGRYFVDDYEGLELAEIYARGSR